MTLSLSNYINDLVTFGNQLVHNATRLTHVGDGAVILLPDGVKTSRYTNVPNGDSLATIQAALTGLTQITGTDAMLDAAVQALRDADLAAVVAVESVEASLAGASNQTIALLTQQYVAAIAACAPYDAIGILFSLANSIIDNSKQPVGSNFIRNSTVQFLPTNVPLYWSKSGAAGATFAYGLDAPTGVPYARCRFFHSPPVTPSTFQVALESAIPNVLPGQTVTFSVWLRAPLGVTNGTAAVLTSPVLDSTGATIMTPTMLATTTTTLTQFSETFVLPASANLPLSISAPTLSFSYTNATLNATVDIGAPVCSVQSVYPAAAASDVSPYITLLRINCLAALGLAIVDYVPANSTETSSIIAQFVALYDATVAPASDYGWTSVCQNLSVLRANVLTYLQQQLAQRPQVLTQTFADSVPDVVAAYSIFGNLDHVDDLVAINNPLNPMQMPTVVAYPNV